MPYAKFECKGGQEYIIPISQLYLHISRTQIKDRYLVVVQGSEIEVEKYVYAYIKYKMDE